MRGLVLNRVVPNTLTTGFSGTTPASVSEPVRRLTISRVVRASSRQPQEARGVQRRQQRHRRQP
jgi:hypothetical protein